MNPFSKRRGSKMEEKTTKSYKKQCPEYSENLRPPLCQGEWATHQSSRGPRQHSLKPERKFLKEIVSFHAGEQLWKKGECFFYFFLLLLSQDDCWILESEAHSLVDGIHIDMKKNIIRGQRAVIYQVTTKLTDCFVDELLKTFLRPNTFYKHRLKELSAAQTNQSSGESGWIGRWSLMLSFGEANRPLWFSLLLCAALAFNSTIFPSTATCIYKPPPYNVHRLSDSNLGDTLFPRHQSLELGRWKSQSLGERSSGNAIIALFG